MTITGWLYAMARAWADGRAVRRSMRAGSLRPIARRARNRLVGRLVWRALWRLLG